MLPFRIFTQKSWYGKRHFLRVSDGNLRNGAGKDAYKRKNGEALLRGGRKSDSSKIPLTATAFPVKKEVQKNPQIFLNLNKKYYFR